MKGQRKYYCTRPRLVTYLVQLGYTPKIMPNPWDPKKVVWIFPYSPELERKANKWLKQDGVKR